MSDRSITTLPPADFTPTLGDYKDLQPFRFWCQKVLPLVYDDSLSYYELLCKVVDYLNKTMEDVGVLEGDVTGLHEAYKKLQGYVNDYFSTLDVQEEINNKLDTMASSGELTNLIAPLLPNLIAEWLSKNITPTTPVIDKTLTISGAGADAKIVGDKFNSALLSFNTYDGTTPLSELKPGWYPVVSSTPKTNLPTDSVFGLLIVYPHVAGVTNNYFIYLDASIKTNYVKVDENNWTTLSNYVNTESLFNSRLTYNGEAELSTLNNGWYPVINITGSNLPVTTGFGLLLVYKNGFSSSNNFYLFYHVNTKTNYIRVDENNWTTLSNYVNTETLFNSRLTYNGEAELSTLNNGWYPVINITGSNLPVTTGFGLLLVYKNGFSSSNNFYLFYHVNTKTNYIRVDENNWTTLSNYASNKFIGETIITYGDSITHANNWQQYLRRELHCSTENYGVDGSKISGNNTTSMCNIERINTLPDLSFLIIMGGMNDWAQNVAIDGDENDITNFTGGCHAMFKNIINKYPSASIYCVGTSFGYMESFSEKTKNNIGLTTLDYSKKLCEIASLYGVPSISAYENMGVCDINKTLFLKNDGDIYIHPNGSGAKRLANLILNLLTGNKYI